MGANEENVRNVLVNGNQVGCSYKEFLACNPKEYDGKGGDVVLTQWIEKMKNVHDMSDCSIDQKVKYIAGSFNHAMVEAGHAAYTVRFHELMRLVPHLVTPESRKIERDNHAMVEAGHAAYTVTFHELARLVPHLVTPESRKIERYVYGLASHIFGMVAATEPKTMQKAVHISGMDWLSNHKAEIICHEKVVRIPLLDGKVFLDNLSGLPHVREIEFQIELIPRATPVAKSPYHLVPSELEDLLGRLKELQDKVFIRPSSPP
nr:hypothetical protein [Tanacetum cinerariifolium]